MAIPTSRTKVRAEIKINEEKCSGCGLCVSVCKDYGIVLQVYIDNMKKGVNLVNYDAPLAIYFYGSPYVDPADPIIAATYAMIAAEALGLGTCMLGAIHPMIQSGKKAKTFREKQGIKYPSREGIFVIFGTFASVTRWEQ